MSEGKNLVELLDLEQIEYDLFRGDSRDIGSVNVFGGQVLGQALNAAARTVEEDRFIHSLHGYFILPGDMTMPILYEVERIRDGGSFTTRRVTAIQKGKAIFTMGVSFQKDEEGLSHQVDMPETPSPDSLLPMETYRKFLLEYAPERYKRFLRPKWPIEIRIVDPINPLMPEKLPPFQKFWLRAIDDLPEKRFAHQSALAYASDFNLLSTSLRPHGVNFHTHRIQLASLDHAMWFHRPFNANEWLLFSIESPNTSNNRGLSMGKVFKQDGTLVATVMQEGLVRIRK